MFKQWLRDVEKQMKRHKFNILLIVDNAPNHIVPDNLPHMKKIFLLPTTTSHIQPLPAT